MDIAQRRVRHGRLAVFRRAVDTPKARGVIPKSLWFQCIIDLACRTFNSRHNTVDRRIQRRLGHAFGHDTDQRLST
jgi:hypothetical protein